MRWPTRNFVVWVNLVGLFFILGCFDSTSSDSNSQSLTFKLGRFNNDSLYRGNTLKFWASYNRRILDSSLALWQVGEGQIIRRAFHPSDSNFTSDTIYVDWDRLPKESFRDSATGLLRYRERVSVSVAGALSQSLNVYLENLRPILDSLKIRTGFTYVPTKDSIFLAISQGGTLELKMYTHDDYKEGSISYFWPSFFSFIGYDKGSDMYRMNIFTNTELDQTGTLEMRDSYGANRKWKLRFLTYQETGSIWVATPFDITKISPKGQRVFKTIHGYKDALTMDLASGRDALFIADPSKKWISKYTALSYQPLPEQLINGLTPISLKSQNDFLWVAGVDLKNNSTVIQYDTRDLKPTGVSLPTIRGKLLEIAPHHDISGAVWYLKSNSDTISLESIDSVYVKNDSVLKLPKLLSWDKQKSVLWVTNGKTVVMLNSNGKSQGKISGFGNISSISAGMGYCWVVDQQDQKLYMFNYSNNSERSVDNLGTSEYMRTLSDPVACSIVQSTVPTCWVAENGSGSVVNYDIFGEQVIRYTGLVAPRVILVNQPN